MLYCFLLRVSSHFARKDFNLQIVCRIVGQPNDEIEAVIKVFGGGLLVEESLLKCGATTDFKPVAVPCVVLNFGLPSRK